MNQLLVIHIVWYGIVLYWLDEIKWLIVDFIMKRDNKMHMLKSVKTAILIFGYINVSYVACKACTVCIEYSENYKMKLFLL